MANERTEIRFTGFGGQGIILAAYITGKAAAIYANLNATLTQNYGPESRGGASSAQIVISKEPIFYPNISHQDILVAMSQEGYTKYQKDLPAGGTLLIEESLVKLTVPRTDIKISGIPATRLAEKVGKKVVTNLVMLGFVIGQTRILSKEAMLEAIKTSVPKGTEELNLKAFNAGYEYQPQAK
jgi:2-oxoglutarate ferredoxin oxidoreductase subunit gamma